MLSFGCLSEPSLLVLSPALVPEILTLAAARNIRSGSHEISIKVFRKVRFRVRYDLQSMNLVIGGSARCRYACTKERPPKKQNVTFILGHQSVPYL